MVSESALSKGHGVHTAFETAVAGLRAAGVRVRVNTLRSASVHHAHTLGPLAQILISRREPVVISAHVTVESLDGSLGGFELWRDGASSYLTWAYNRADRVVAVSPYVEERLRAAGVTAPIVVVPNAIDPDRFAPSPVLREQYRARLGLEQGQPLALACGQLQPRKAVDTFVRVARQLPGARFVWLGGRPVGPLTAGYLAVDGLVAGAPPNVCFTGTVPFATVPGYYNAADVFFLPSRQETFCIAAIEAAACGLPLVLRDLDVYRPLFGTRYVACDEASFVPALRSLLGDPIQLARQGALSRELAAPYALPGVTRRLIALYEELAS